MLIRLHASPVLFIRAQLRMFYLNSLYGLYGRLICADAGLNGMPPQIAANQTLLCDLCFLCALCGGPLTLAFLRISVQSHGEVLISFAPLASLCGCNPALQITARFARKQHIAPERGGYHRTNGPPTKGRVVKFITVLLTCVFKIKVDSFFNIPP